MVIVQAYCEQTATVDGRAHQSVQFTSHSEVIFVAHSTIAF